MGLNPSQQTNIEVELIALENGLRRAQRLLREPEAGVLTRYRPAPERMRRRLEPLIEQGLARIQAVADEFRLRPRIEDVRRHIRADMALAQNGLYDSQSAKLRRYGAVDPRLAETLDPHLKDLMALARQIERIVVEGR